MFFSLDQSEKVYSVKSIVVFFVLLTTFFSFEIGNRPFANPDEARYVEISREMLKSGDFVTPRLNNVKYFEKPPLFYWIGALNQKIFGIDFAKQRLSQVIIALLGIVTLFGVLLKVHGTHVAYTASAVLSTSFLFFFQTRFINLDLLLTVTLSISLLSYYMAVVNRTDNKKLFLRCFYVFSALACLSKGLIGIVLPLAIIFLWICIKNGTVNEKLKTIKKSIDCWGIILFLCIFAPWHMVCAFRNAEFVNFYFIYEHFTRYLTESHQRTQPWWFFLAIIPCGLFPWVGFIFGKMSFFKKSEISENLKFLCSWIFAVTLFFSVSKSKLIPYILPVFPPLAIIIALFIEEYSQEKRYYKNYIEYRKNYLDKAFFISFAFIIGIFLAFKFLQYSKLDFIAKNESVNVLVYAFFGVFAVLFVVWEVCSYLTYKKHLTPTFLIGVFCFFAANAMLVINRIAPYYQDVKKPSTYTIAQYIKYNLYNDTEIFCYNDYFQDLPIYLGRVIGVVDFKGELEFGINQMAKNVRFLSEKIFFERFEKSEKRIFVCMKKEKFKKFMRAYNGKYIILKVTKDFVVVINR